MTGTVIAGIGQTEFSKDSGRSALQLAAEAGLAAIQDAGMTPSDIDGMVTFAIDENDELDLMRSLGLDELHYWSRVPGGGYAACATVQNARAAIASGQAKAVLIYRAMNERSGRRFGQPLARRTGAAPLDLHFTYGVTTAAQMYGLWFRRYMYEYGLTNEDFGRYVVTVRGHAATNPNAWFYQRPITLEDHQSSRWIVEPVLRLFDCCQESDGGVALVLTAGDRVPDIPSPVAVVGVADVHVSGTSIMNNYYLPDLSGFPDAERCATRLFQQTGLTPADIDVAEIYENFSPLALMVLEAFGFCGRGEAASYIADGNIELDGALPVNTHGGLLGEAYIHGMNTLVEGVRQARGQAVNQVPGAEHILVSSLSSALILRSP